MLQGSTSTRIGAGVLGRFGLVGLSTWAVDDVIEARPPFTG